MTCALNIPVIYRRIRILPPGPNLSDESLAVAVLQGREFAVLQIVKYFGFANQTNGLYTLALSEEGAMPQAIDIQQVQLTPALPWPVL